MANQGSNMSADPSVLAVRLEQAPSTDGVHDEAALHKGAETVSTSQEEVAIMSDTVTDDGESDMELANPGDSGSVLGAQPPSVPASPASTEAGGGEVTPPRGAAATVPSEQDIATDTSVSDSFFKKPLPKKRKIADLGGSSHGYVGLWCILHAQHRMGCKI